jgi:hypothetical protein
MGETDNFKGAPLTAADALALESAQPSLAYPRAQVALTSQHDRFFVVSDLHLGAGLQPDQSYDGNEHFFADASFERLLDRMRSTLGGQRATLVINGDFVDFLRVTDVPSSQAMLSEWVGVLADVGVESSQADLAAKVSDKERQFGLNTEEPKSVWKLSRVVAGHPLFFSALARWIDEGNDLIIVKGNHDLDWYWPRVRAYLRVWIARQLSSHHGRSADGVAAAVTPPRVLFVDDVLVINGTFRIEHGHRYDKFTTVRGGPLMAGNKELNLPFGSFFNRYLLNSVELDFPYFPNVRPPESLLPMLVRERFPLALTLLFRHVPFMLRVIPKRYYRYMFGKVAVLALAVLAPVALVAWELWTRWPPLRDLLSGAATASQDGGTILKAVLSGASSFGWLVLSYVLARVVAYFQLVEPDSLSAFAQPLLARFRLVTFGHTHNPDVLREGDAWFFNTGTWIPIIGVTDAEVREDRTYTVLDVRFDDEVPSGALLRWNDDAGRLEPFTLVKTAPK